MWNQVCRSYDLGYFRQRQTFRVCRSPFLRPLHSMAHMSMSCCVSANVSLFSGNIANISDPCRKDCISFFCSCHRMFVTDGMAKNMLYIFSGMVITIAFVLLWSPGLWGYGVSWDQLYITIKKVSLMYLFVCLDFNVTLRTCTTYGYLNVDT